MAVSLIICVICFTKYTPVDHSKCAEWRRNYRESKKLKVPYIGATIHSVPESRLNVSLYASRFRPWLTGHFDTTALNDPKMTVNTTYIPHCRSRLSHICGTRVFWVTNFAPFRSTTNCFESQAFWTRIVHSDTYPGLGSLVLFALNWSYQCKISFKTQSEPTNI